LAFQYHRIIYKRLPEGFMVLWSMDPVNLRGYVFRVGRQVGGRSFQ
jgi:hypothetical protein